MNVNASNLKGKFADLKYEQLLADKYFIETCFSKKFNSRPLKEELKDIILKLKAYALKCDGIVILDCNLQDEFCDSNGETTTTTTTTSSTTTTTTEAPSTTTTTTV